MKIISTSLCIIAISMCIANLKDLHISEIKIKPVECSLGFVPLNGAGLRNSAAPPPPARVKRKLRRGAQTDPSPRRPQTGARSP